MKQLKLYLIGLILLPSIAILLTGCPTSISHPLDEVGKNKIDKNLLGTWKCVGDSCNELVTVKVIEGNEKNSYDIEVTEVGEFYGIEETKFTSYITEIDGWQFIYSLAKGTTSYYLYGYKLNDKQSLSIWDMSLLANGVDGISDTKTYREEVRASLKKANCFSNQIDFKREN